MSFGRCPFFPHLSFFIKFNNYKYFNNLETTLRLVNGVNPYSGRVEVFHNSKWGTVCREGFTKDEAQVVCRNYIGIGHNAST